MTFHPSVSVVYAGDTLVSLLSSMSSWPSAYLVCIAYVDTDDNFTFPDFWGTMARAFILIPFTSWYFRTTWPCSIAKPGMIEPEVLEPEKTGKNFPLLMSLSVTTVSGDAVLFGYSTPLHISDNSRNVICK